MTFDKKQQFKKFAFLLTTCFYSSRIKMSLEFYPFLKMKRLQNSCFMKINLKLILQKQSTLSLLFHGEESTSMNQI